MNPAAQGSSNHTYRNAYTGIQPLRNSVDVGSQLRGEVRSTPQTHRHRAPGTTNMGPPNLQGAVSGTPRGTPKETPRVSRGHVDLRQPQNPPMRFSGVGLGPGLAGLGSSRHTMDSNGATNHESFSAPSISSRAGFRDSRAPQATASAQSLTGQRHGVIVGSRAYDRL